jgi:uncharacterized protein Veg
MDRNESEGAIVSQQEPKITKGPKFKVGDRITWTHVVQNGKKIKMTAREGKITEVTAGCYIVKLRNGNHNQVGFDEATKADEMSALTKAFKSFGSSNDIPAWMGPNGFVFLDERPWPFLVKSIEGQWWLYYWSDGNKNFVTMRKLHPDEIEKFRPLALPLEKAILYAPVSFCEVKP